MVGAVARTSEREMTSYYTNEEKRRTANTPCGLVTFYSENNVTWPEKKVSKQWLYSSP